jgi:membrane protein YdbS with pleckstrin-like domain
MIFGGLVLIGWAIVVGAVSIYVFGSYADLSLTIILVAIGLILIVLAIPVYKWERNHFTREKEIVEFKNQKGNVILRQVRPKDGRKKKSKN